MMRGNMSLVKSLIAKTPLDLSAAATNQLIKAVAETEAINFYSSSVFSY